MRVKAIFRRLRQLECKHSDWLAATDASDARERFMAHINRMAARLRADPNFKPPTTEQAEAISQHLQAFFAAKANDTAWSAKLYPGGWRASQRGKLPTRREY